MTPRRRDTDRVDPHGRLPYTFSIVGVQKSGTSTLMGSLNQHRRVCRPPRKERHYFDQEDYDWSAPDYDRDYTAPRRSKAQWVVGDATPTYLFWPHALDRMRSCRPDMRLVAVFRDPVERIFSHWTMLRSRSPEWPDWPEFLTRLRPSSLPDEIPPGVSPQEFQHLSGVARGYYAEQLERGFAVFPRDQWLLLEFRTMLRDWEASLARVVEHLGLPPFDAPPGLRHRHAGAELVPGTAPTGADVAGLVDLYREDLHRLAGLTDLDVSGWPTWQVLEGTLDPAEVAGRLAARVDPVRGARGSSAGSSSTATP